MTEEWRPVGDWPYEVSSHGLATLTEDDIRAIRRARAAGVSTRELAERYGVRHPAISRIANRQRWQHVP